VLGRGRRTSLGRSRDSRSSRQCQTGSMAANAESSSPSSKTTARFTGSGRVSSCEIGWIGTPSRSTGLVNRRRHGCSLIRAGSVRRRHTRPISFSFGCRAPVSRTPRTCRRRVGSRGICTRSTVLPLDSTSCRVTRVTVGYVEVQAGGLGIGGGGMVVVRSPDKGRDREVLYW
jgi:hypothetical protein